LLERNSTHDVVAGKHNWKLGGSNRAIEQLAIEA
jgi:hypothetical protein